jgi:adsorption protein B
MWWLDGLAVDILAPLAVWVFASSLDDLILDASYVWFWFRSRGGSGSRDSSALNTEAPQVRIAIVVPCWDEAAVIEDMLDHNIAAIDYTSYEIWLGVYPNDHATRAKAESSAGRHVRVRYVVCPREGPTTKADCLNAIYQGLVEYERRTGKRYGIVLQHDAEDLIHPDSLRRIQQAARQYDMVQIPVFPLETGLSELTHGTYGDFFAEFHLKELRQRAAFGGFVPSAGVGTAYRRESLEALWEHNGGRLFDDASLTEDYSIGLQLHKLGRSQTLLHAPAGPTSSNLTPRARGVPVATRAYFPNQVRQAIRQRARWVTGIALQSWQKFGWRAGRDQIYWLWRDRKGLLGHPVSLLANVVFAYGVLRWLWAEHTGATWRLGILMTAQPWLLALLLINTVMILWRQVVRGVFVERVYGWKYALTVPVRAPWANWIDCCATLTALWTFGIAQVRNRKLSWAKTAHSYPSRARRVALKPRLGEILVAAGRLTEHRLDQALSGRLSTERIGEALVRQGVVSEPDVYQALSRQQEVPFQDLKFKAVHPDAFAGLSPAVARDLCVMPYRRDVLNQVWVATPLTPSAETERVLTELLLHRPRFVLITPTNYRELIASLAERAEPTSAERAQVAGAAG